MERREASRPARPSWWASIFWWCRFHWAAECGGASLLSSSGGTGCPGCVLWGRCRVCVVGRSVRRLGSIQWLGMGSSRSCVVGRSGRLLDGLEAIGLGLDFVFPFGVLASAGIGRLALVGLRGVLCCCRRRAAAENADRQVGVGCLSGSVFLEVACLFCVRRAAAAENSGRKAAVGCLARWVCAARVGGVARAHARLSFPFPFLGAGNPSIYRGPQRQF